MAVSGVLRMSKSWQLLCSFVDNTFNSSSPSLVRPSLFTFQFEICHNELFSSSFCMPVFVSPQHRAMHAMALSSLQLGRHSTDHALFVHARLVFVGTQPTRSKVGTDFSSLLQFCAALSQPVGIKGMIESFHRLPRSKSLEIS